MTFYPILVGSVAEGNETARDFDLIIDHDLYIGLTNETGELSPTILKKFLIGDIMRICDITLVKPTDQTSDSDIYYHVNGQHNRKFYSTDNTKKKIVAETESDESEEEKIESPKPVKKGKRVIVSDEDEEEIESSKPVKKGKRVIVSDVKIESNFILFEGSPIIVASDTILYIMKKSHIHRMLRSTSIKSINLNIWKKQVNAYNVLRKRLGYKRMDKLLFNDIISFESKLFMKRFKEVSTRVGDTTHKFDDAEEFFNDNVPRVIEHDKLHEETSKLFRLVPEAIFPRFLVKPTDVEMNEELFGEATRADQIACIIEEIYVLLLERQVIPNVIQNHILTIDELENQLDEIRTHFITNLCGAGHFWLRRWCIDHFDYLIQADYKLQGIVSHAKAIISKYTTIAIITSKDEELITLNKIIGTIVELVKKPKYTPMRTWPNSRPNNALRLENGHEFNKEQMITIGTPFVYDCTTDEFSEIPRAYVSVNLSSTLLSKISNCFTNSLIICNDSKNSDDEFIEYIIVSSNAKYGFYFNGKTQYIILIDKFTIEESNGLFSAKAFSLSNLSKDYEFNANIEPECVTSYCYGSGSDHPVCDETEDDREEVHKYTQLSRQGQPRKFMDLFESYFIAIKNRGGY